MRHFIAVLLLLVFAGSLTANQLNNKQKQFIAAEKALLANNDSQYQQLKKSLKNYPLYGYLDYYQYQKNLANISLKQIKSFQQRYADSPISHRLGNQWLLNRAKKQQWGDFLGLYHNQNSPKYRCYYLQALIYTGQSKKALSKVESLWLSSKSQPKACDPVFKRWIANGQLTDKLVWQRISLALTKNNTRLAKYLGKYLKRSKDTSFLSQWITMHRSPLSLTKGKRLAKHKRYNIAMQDISLRLIKRHPDVAFQHKSLLLKPSHLSKNARQQLNQKLAYRLLINNHEQALSFAKTITAPEKKLADIRLRKAIGQQQWKLVANWITQLPDATQNSARWQYWLARSLEQSGNKNAAKKLYQEAAGDRSYYGFLAADKAANPYNLNHTELTVPIDLKKVFAGKAAIKRIVELYAINKNIDARREWNMLTRQLDKQALKVAAKVAYDNGWRDRAIFTLAKTGYWEDLELRFPLLHIKTVEKQARKTALDSAWILAIIRQESVFMHDAHSRVGATGLMQLMPATAKRVAKRLGRKKPRRRDLEQPTINITLGSHYLGHVFKQLKQNKVLATAAYNAGPHRVKKWLPNKAMAMDVWVESIPFNETRTYVRRVMSYTVLYQHRQGKKTQTITSLMGTINRSLIAANQTQAKNKT